MKYWRKPLDTDTIEVPKGKVYILENRCKGCKFCVEFCPRKCLEVSTKFNEKGYHPPVLKNEADCIACGFCELICPDFAIYLEEKGTRPAGEVKKKSEEVGAQ